MNAPSRLYMAWLVSLVATIGSLYFSEVMRFIPCTLCWYQRIAMYPLTLILGIAAFRQDLNIRIYAIPLAVIGAGISAFHILEEQGLVAPPAACSVGVPCSTKYINWLGFITIPTLALVAFVLIIALLAYRTAPARTRRG